MQNEIGTTELNQKLLTYLDGLEGRAAKAEQFLASETPLYVQEYLSWQTQYTMFTIVASLCGMLLLLVLWVCVFRLDRHLSKTDKEYAEGFLPFFATSFGCVVFIALIIAFFVNVGHYIKLRSAPRVVVVEHLQDLIKASR